MNFSLLLVIFLVILIQNFHAAPTSNEVSTDPEKDQRLENEQKGRQAEKKARLSTTTESKEFIDVQTHIGEIRGFESTYNGKQVRSFLGVPFAQPPIGQNRFKKPVPLKYFRGSIPATELAPACFQSRDSYGDSRGGFWGSDMWNADMNRTSEDCLYLNIWAPADAKNLPVIIWIFGGGFYSGSPSLSLYDGKELATRKNVVVVNINYRVGPFGFLYLDHKDVPGNMGMLDQQLALRWIRNSIKAFGGDPDNMSLVGESAGAASIVAHLIAPQSKSMFRNAILQSGALDNRWSMDSTERALNKSNELAKLVNCNLTEVEDTIQCLIDINATTLVNHMWSVPLNFLEFPFVIVSQDKNFFQHKDAFEALRNGDYSRDVNLMFGINRDEGNFWNIYNMGHYFDNITRNPDTQAEPEITREEFEGCVEQAFKFQPDVVRNSTKYVYSHLNETDSDIPREYYSEQVNQMVGDYFFTCDSVSFANEYSRNAAQNTNVFVYFFNQTSSGNPWPKWTGVMHGYEIEFVFGVPIYNNTANYTSAEIDVAEKVMDWWTTFATNGVPKLRNSSENIVWKPYHFYYNKKWMNIRAGAFGMMDELKKTECDFWRNVKNAENLVYKSRRNSTTV